MIHADANDHRLDSRVIHVDAEAQGVTLPELVVVLLIISVLGALIAAAVPRLRERYVRSEICEANLKHIFLGLHMYIQDSSGVLPEANCDSGASGSNWYQVLVLKGYLTDRQCFVCPSDPSPDTFNTGPHKHPKSAVPYRGIAPACYYYDGRAGTYRPGDGLAHADALFPEGGSYGLNRELSGHTLDQIMFNSRTPFVMDSVHPSFEDGTQVTCAPDDRTVMPHDGPFAGPHNARWHGGFHGTPYVVEDVDANARNERRLRGGSYVLFLDGHVAFIGGNSLGNRAPRCDTDATKYSGEYHNRPFDTAPTEPNCGEEVD